MSVVVAENTEHHQLVCKGALQEILNVCSQVRHNGEIVPLDDTMLRKIKRVTDTLNRQGLRVVAVATKYLPAREGDYQRADESDPDPRKDILLSLIRQKRQPLRH